MPFKWRDVTHGEVYAHIDRLDYSTDQVVLTGGEPSISKNFFNILECLRNKLPMTKIVLITNARRFYYENFANAVCNAGVHKFITEIHGHTKELHESITRTKGSFNQTVVGIKNLLKIGAAVEMRIVISKLNYRHTPAIAKYITKNFIGIKGVVIFPIDLVGNARVYDRILSVKYRDLLPYVERTIGYLKRKGVETHLYHFPFCVLKPGYWGMAEGKTVEKQRLFPLDMCKLCVMEPKCAGVWKTYAEYFGMGEFKPITSGVNGRLS